MSLVFTVKYATDYKNEYCFSGDELKLSPEKLMPVARLGGITYVAVAVRPSPTREPVTHRESASANAQICQDDRHDGSPKTNLG